MTMFKKSGKGRMKPFCINETCEDFLPEDQRGYYRKKTAQESPDASAEQTAEEKKSAAKKPSSKKTAAKKSATKKTTTRKTKKTEADT